MTEKVLARREFSIDNQLAFGRASGDVNPVHVSGDYARRTMFGEMIVHGVHGVMWALDRYLADGGAVPQTVRAQFAKPMFLGEQVTLVRSQEGSETVLTLSADGVALTIVRLNPTLRPKEVEASSVSASWFPEPLPLGREEIRNRERTLPAHADVDALRSMFPVLVEKLGVKATVTLALLSRLVGMDCPGMQSLFAGLSFTLQRENGVESFAYKVERSEPAFAPIEVNFAGPDLVGSVSAFYRPAEVSQPSTATLKDRVDPADFSTQTALVIGGSRGLGELTAKLLAAGGADVTITYAVGATDAERIREDIVNSGGKCRVRQLDVLRAGEPEAAGSFDGTSFNTVYYFATPRIGGRRSHQFEVKKLHLFQRYYTEAFADICLFFGRTAPGKVTVFYPSTIFIEQHSRENIEYAMAKAAGEVLGDYFTSAGTVRVVSRRLPKMATDQTAGIMKVEMADSVQVLVEAIREVSKYTSVPAK